MTTRNVVLGLFIDSSKFNHLAFLPSFFLFLSPTSTSRDHSWAIFSPKILERLPERSLHSLEGIYTDDLRDPGFKKCGYQHSLSQHRHYGWLELRPWHLAPYNSLEFSLSIALLKQPRPRSKVGFSDPSDFLKAEVGDGSSQL